MEQQQNDNSHASAQSRAEGANLTDVLAADKRDAERYRWLKEHGYANEKNASNAVIGDNKKARVAFRYWCSPSTLDELIDAAIGG